MGAPLRSLSQEDDVAHSWHLTWRLPPAAAIVLALSSFAPQQSMPQTSEAAYLAENEAAMKKMMAGMAVKPTGDVDRDFVDMMVPHHQGAIDMAVALLRYGRNEKVRRLAQEIIVTQQEEIAAMRRAVGEKLPPLTAAPTQGRAARSNSVSDGMKMK
jgi:hypothetical protein